MPKEDIAWAVQDIAGRKGQYDLYDDYFMGNHSLTFATEKWRNAFGALMRKLRLNMIPGVVEAHSDRLRITGFDGEGALAKKADEFWKAKRLARTQNDLHLSANLYGDAFLVVWPAKDGKSRYWMHDGDAMAVDYDDEDDPNKILKAGKLWLDSDGHARVTLYYEDAVESYRSARKVQDGNSFPEKADQYDSVKKIDNPHGMPVFHFAPGAPVGNYGLSVIRDVITIQDALNKTICDMLVDSEFIAFPQRWATGLQVEADEETGKVVNPPFTPGSDRMFTGGENTTFGQFPQGDLAQYVAVADSFAKWMGRVAGVPPHILMPDSEAPNGESLKVSEGRLVNKVTRDIAAFGDVWNDAVAFGMRIDGEAQEEETVTSVWAPPTPHNPLLDAETQLVKKQVGVSNRQSLRELGYTDTQIEQMMKEAADDAKQKAEEAAHAASLMPMPAAGPGGPSAFNRNGAPGKASTPAPAKQQRGKEPVKPK